MKKNQRISLLKNVTLRLSLLLEGCAKQADAAAAKLGVSRLAEVLLKEIITTPGQPVSTWAKLYKVKVSVARTALHELGDNVEVRKGGLYPTAKGRMLFSALNVARFTTPCVQLLRPADIRQLDAISGRWIRASIRGIREAVKERRPQGQTSSGEAQVRNVAD